MSQFYITEAENEYVIKGNSAIVKCKIPSFVTDFVSIESWIFDDGLLLTHNSTNATTDYGRNRYNCSCLIIVVHRLMQPNLRIHKSDHVRSSNGNF